LKKLKNYFFNFFVIKKNARTLSFYIYIYIYFPKLSPDIKVQFPTQFKTDISDLFLFLIKVNVFFSFKFIKELNIVKKKKKQNI